MNSLATKKITRSTLKRFISHNREGLLIMVKSDYSGMIDCCEYYNDATFEPAQERPEYLDNTLGVLGLWLVGGSRDYFDYYEDNQHIGIRYSNCCGSGVIAIKK